MATTNHCIVEGCDHPCGKRADYCEAHYQRVRTLGHPDADRPVVRRSRQAAHCKIKGCDRRTKAKGLCSTHYARHLTGNLNAGQPIKVQRHGEGWIDQSGYRRVGTQREHRVVMEQHLGRKLDSDEHVHHINGDRLDNRVDNLELWVVRRQPPGQRIADRVADALETLRRYSPELLAPGGGPPAGRPEDTGQVARNLYGFSSSTGARRT